MEDHASNEGSIWPIPKLRFEVDFGPELNGVTIQEVLGLDVSTQIIEYRHNNGKSRPSSNENTTQTKKNSNITIKKAVFPNNNNFWRWHELWTKNKIKRHTIFIKLLDENGKVTMQWQLNNAWPTKITSIEGKSDGSEVTAETIEIACEQIIFPNPSSN